ncbi:MAG TPA: choice-of-anchor R domain-containing protein, partial [Roseiflexaceae bacterium]|nr:choice-of-anchor R domain-containing protein [Roseiflexaceae bacterium]
MKLTTSFFGDDLLFEGDVALTLRALPAGARVTRAVATLAPVASSRAGSQPFVEEFAVAGGGGPFGLLVEAEPAPPAAVVDLGARRTVQRLGVTGLASGSAGGAFLQLDMGGVWVMLDNQGSPTTTVTPARRRFVVTDPPSPNPQNLPPALALPGLQGQRLRLTHAGASTAAIAVQRVTLRSYPSNVTLRLGDLGPVWFKVGDLREAAVTPDFAAILDAFTQRVAPEGGVYEVPFTLHSDTLARLRVTLEIEFFLSQPLLPPPLTQAVFSFGYSATPEGAPAPLRAVLPLNARAIPGATAAQVSGRFGASRVVHGPVRATSYADTVTVAGGQTVAHPIRLAAPATVDAIDLHVEAVTSEAALLVTLQEDVSGKPWGASLFAEPVRVELARPPAGGARWASAPLAAPFTFQPDTVYWLVVTAAEGEARWAVAPAGTLPPLQRTTDGGLSYRAVRSETLGGAVAGIYRLRTTPAQFRQPLKLDVAGHEVSLARFDALGKVDFLLDLPEVAQAVDAALQDAAAAQGLLAERVANGDFTRWTRFE